MVLRSDVWGRGFATEAGRACIEWGFRSFDLPYLTAMIHPDNPRSIRVADRLGMRSVRSDMLGEIAVVVYSLERPVDRLDSRRGANDQGRRQL